MLIVAHDFAAQLGYHVPHLLQDSDDASKMLFSECHMT